MDLSWIYHVMNRSVSHGMLLVGLFWAVLVPERRVFLTLKLTP